MPSDTSIEGRAFVCPHCEHPSIGRIKGRAEWGGRDHEGDVIAPPTEYLLLQCSRCSDVALQIREDYGGGFVADDPVIVFPAQKSLGFAIPEALRNEFKEAQSCFAAKAYTAAVVMVRRTLEGTCRENGIKERTLAESLKKMSESGLIDSTLAEWADALRALGNAGAHYTGARIAREDAEDALAFSEAMLDQIYVLKKKFEAFKARRNQPESKARVSTPSQDSDDVPF